MTFLISNGYEVFRNFSQHGMADLVAVDFDAHKIYLIDVKTAHEGETGADFNRRVLTTEQHDAGISLLQVSHGGVVKWDRVSIPPKYT